MSPRFNSFLLLRDEEDSKYGGGVGSHKMHIFAANIPTFHARYKDRCLLLTSSTSFLDILFQEYRMGGKASYGPKSIHIFIMSKTRGSPK
jgi:hypothetical protein